MNQLGWVQCVLMLFFSVSSFAGEDISASKVCGFHPAELGFQHHAGAIPGVSAHPTGDLIGTEAMKFVANQLANGMSTPYQSCGMHAGEKTFFYDLSDTGGSVAHAYVCDDLEHTDGQDNCSFSCKFYLIELFS